MGDGVRREWFQLLAAELTAGDLGLFESADGGATLAPAPHASLHCDAGPSAGGRSSGSGSRAEHLRAFELVGCMLGLALLQGCTLPGFRLAPAAWRFIFGQAPAPEADLAAADPQLARNLALLRQLAAASSAGRDEVAALGLHFEVADALGRTVRGPGCRAPAAFVL